MRERHYFITHIEKLKSYSMYTEIETENVMCNFVKKIFLEMWLLCFSIAKKTIWKNVFCHVKMKIFKWSVWQNLYYFCVKYNFHWSFVTSFHTFSVFWILCFLLGNTPASELYMPTFGTLGLFLPHRQVVRSVTGGESSWSICTGEGVTCK